MREFPDVQLPGDVAALLSEVVDSTANPLLLVEKERIGYDSQLGMARRNQAYHELAYGSLCREHHLHFIVDAAVKIQRVWTVPADERLIPASDASRDLPAKEEAELRRKLHGLSETAFKELSTYLYRGLTQQLTSMPVDIRVEREIKSDHEDGQRGVRCSSNMNRQTHIS